MRPRALRDRARAERRRELLLPGVARRRGDPGEVLRRQDGPFSSVIQ